MIQNSIKLLEFEDPIDPVVYLLQVIGYFAELSNAEESGSSFLQIIVYLLRNSPSIQRQKRV